MSFTKDSSNLKIWDNAAFNDLIADYIADYPAGAKSLLPLQPISTNLLHFHNHSPYKEKPSKKPGIHDTSSSPIPDDDGNLDATIEQVENEIRRLSLKLEALRIKKAEMDLKSSAAKRGRIIPAKFMEQKPSPASKKTEESPAILRRRGSSLGPIEIHRSAAAAAKSCFQKLEGIKEENTPPNPLPCLTRTRTRKSWLHDDSIKPCFRQRGVSLGPTEIAFGSRLHLPSKQSMSVSPRSRKPAISTMSEFRKGIATVVAKKPVKKDDFIIRSIKTNNLFQDMQNTVSCRKPLKKSTVRSVASRYSLSTGRNIDPEKKQRNRSLSVGETSNGESLLLTAMLPKIRTVRNIDDSGRDSGCVGKRAAQLAGKKSYFRTEEGCSEEDSSMFDDFPCNFLKYEE